MTEEWRAVPGYEGFYEASTEGRVRSLDRIDAGGRQVKGKVLSPGVLKESGRLQVSLSKDRQIKQMKVHQVVALTYHGPCPEGMEVRHYPDRDVTNNRPENLCYGSKRQNQLDSIEHGTHPMASKTHCPRGHLLKGPNLHPGRAHRECLSCSRGSDLLRTRSEIGLDVLSDACYRELTEGVPNPYRLTDWERSQGRKRHTQKEHCPRGHLLQEPNLSQHHLRRGRRVCLACVRAGDRIRRTGRGDVEGLSDLIYQEIMKEVPTPAAPAVMFGGLR